MSIIQQTMLVTGNIIMVQEDQGVTLKYLIANLKKKYIYIFQDQTTINSCKEVNPPT